LETKFTGPPRPNCRGVPDTRSAAVRNRRRNDNDDGVSLVIIRNKYYAVHIYVLSKCSESEKKNSNKKPKSKKKYIKVFVWYIPDSVAVVVGLRDTRSCTSSTTSYAGRKKSNPTEMLGKVFPALSTAAVAVAAAAAAAAAITHTPRPHERSRPTSADTEPNCWRRGGQMNAPADLRDTLPPAIGSVLAAENGGGASHCCAARGTCHGSRSKWIFSKASLLKTCFVCRIFSTPSHSLNIYVCVCVCVWPQSNEIFNHKIKPFFVVFIKYFLTRSKIVFYSNSKTSPTFNNVRTRDNVMIKLIQSIYYIHSRPSYINEYAAV